MTKPPVIRTMTSTSQAPVPSRMRTEMTLLEDREKARILLLPLRRQRPLCLHRLVELRSEEVALHAAVDDVPRQHGVARSIAEHEEVGIDACFGDGGAPVAAVALGGLDGGSDAPIPERQQRLVERMPLRLD